MKRSYINIIALFLLLFTLSEAEAARIKDVAAVSGTSSTQAIGYGLVVGLNNQGDNQASSFTAQSVSNMLKRFGLTVPEMNPRTRNVAAVMITAEIPAFAKKGAKVDVSVSSIGDARSLQGGVLILSPMSMANGEIVGMAQGALSVGGYDFEALGTSVKRNNSTSGRVPGGLILEADINNNDRIVENNKVRISLFQPDFNTARNIAGAVNGASLGTATILDAATVEVELPTDDRHQNMESIAEIQALQIMVDSPARVVINERTGTIVMGGNVEVLPSVIGHGGLEVKIEKQIIIPEQAPFTIRPPYPQVRADVEAKEERNPVAPLTVPTGSTVQNIVEALNALKVSSRDLISIFQALKASGALQAELIIQ